MLPSLLSAAVLSPDGDVSLSSTAPGPVARATYNVKKLTGSKWLAPVVAVHERVRAEMPEDRRFFLLPRSRTYYRDLLAEKTGVLFGAFADDELVGSMALVWAPSFAEARNTGALTCPKPVGRFGRKFSKGSAGIIQALGLRKVCLGRKLSCALLSAAIEAAGQQGCAHLFAQVAASNIMSWLRFMERDFAIVTTWDSGHRRFLLYRITPNEKTRLAGHAMDRQILDKDYATLSTLLARVMAHVAQKGLVFLDNEPDSTDRVVVFTEA